MKRLCLLLLLAGNASILFSQRPIDVTHYQFSIQLNDRNDSIRAEALIQFTCLMNGTELSLDFTNLKKEGKGMIAQQVSLSTGAPLSFEQRNDKLIVRPASAFKQGDSIALSIKYAGIPSDGLIISRNKYKQRSFFADNWPNRGHNWLPCVDEPGDKATVDFIVTAPQHYQVVANGVLIEESNLPGELKLSHWHEDVPIATKVMVIGVAEFAVNLSAMVEGCIPVYSWVYPQDREKGFYDYAQAADILPFFIHRVGPYGYKKLANVQSKTIFGGLENANTIFYSENSVTGTRVSESLLAHEIAHQWFGNMATEKTFAHLWLSEGFATFMTTWYMESRYGPDTAISMLRKDRQDVIAFAKESDRPVVDDNSDYMQLLNVNSYQKGGWILHMLRRQLGDTLFTRGIRAYYARYAGKNADTRDLQQVLEQVTGKKLGTFFTQWLYTPGIPLLDIQWTYSPKEKTVTISVKQQQQRPFEFPLQIGMMGSNGKSTAQLLQVNKADQTFHIPVKEKITSLVLDPAVSLLFDGKVAEKK